jgi:DNA segregation ATPase FtsK/SpoIIIE, S-DNA-T family
MNPTPIKPNNSIEGKISAKLRGLGVNGFSVKEPMIGPVVTGYPLALGASTSISTIMNKSEDIALHLGVESVDIRRIGGQVIIFVPNKDRKIVDFKDALYWLMKDDKVKEMQLPILLGMDYHGFNSAIDLVTQPHILIAGSTGSGKSIFESAVIAALVTMLNSKQLHLYIVDPKRVDLALFDGLPHVKRVVKDIEDWYPTINYLYDEVQNRNKVLEKAGCRNILEFNQKSKSKMAFKILIIDELADLIEKDKYHREEQKAMEEELDLKAIDAIKRLIQVSRAAGIHIIACTQRTSVDIVTGTVKANFPTRISLRLPTKTDSRTILDENGAENLLGNGDMLLKAANSDGLERFHAPFVRIEDIKFILEQNAQIKEALGVM